MTNSPRSESHAWPVPEMPDRNDDRDPNLDELDEEDIIPLDELVEALEPARETLWKAVLVPIKRTQPTALLPQSTHPLTNAIGMSQQKQASSALFANDSNKGKVAESIENSLKSIIFPKGKHESC